MFHGYEQIQLPSGRYAVRIGHNGWKHPVDMYVDLQAGEEKTIDANQHFGYVEVGDTDAEWKLKDSEGNHVYCCTLKPGAYWLYIEDQRSRQFTVEAGRVTRFSTEQLVGRIRAVGPEAGHKHGRLVFLKKDDPGEKANRLYIWSGGLRDNPPSYVTAPAGEYLVNYEYGPNKQGRTLTEIQVTGGEETVLDLRKHLALVYIKYLPQRANRVSLNGYPIHGDGRFWLKPGNYSVTHHGKSLYRFDVSAGQNTTVDMRKYYAYVSFPDLNKHSSLINLSTGKSDTRWHGNRCACGPIAVAPGSYKVKITETEFLEFTVKAGETRVIKIGQRR